MAETRGGFGRVSVESVGCEGEWGVADGAEAREAAAAKASCRRGRTQLRGRSCRAKRNVGMVVMVVMGEKV